MDPLARLSFVGLVALLFAKFVVLIAIQGRRRMRTKTFRWSEDAEASGGRVASTGEDALVERAQAALRNDTESQGLFLVAAGAWVVLGAGGLAALGAFGAYAVARSFHTLFLLRPRQPARTRAFAAGHVVMLGVLADGLRLALVGWKY